MASWVILVMALIEVITCADVIIDAPCGKIRGSSEQALEKPVRTFLGIPFARPPIGNRRFKRPEPMPRWDDIKDAKTPPNSCYQGVDTAFGRMRGVEMWNPNTPVSEDCLYLNVWAPPVDDKGNDTDYLAVLIWIYGGGFYSGTSTLEIYDGKVLATEGNVIVVSMQYRLGPFGFLYLDGASPGNQGLIDQHMAIKWVRDNIRAFGGDVNRITIFGESAGGASTSFQLLSPLNKGLFHRAAMQSGTAIAPWAFHAKEDAEQRTKRLGKLVNCGEGSNWDIVECLRNVPAQKLSDLQWLLVPAFFGVPFRPVIDGYFLTQKPIDVLATNNQLNVSILIGSNKDEGIYFMLYGMADAYPYHDNYTPTFDEFKETMKSALRKPSKLVLDAAMFEYVNSKVPVERGSYRDVMDDLVGDYNFICPTTDFSEWYANSGNRVYYYRFNYRSPTNPWPNWTGVMHGYEIEFIFGYPLYSSIPFSDEDKAISLRMLSFWTNFAKTGDPNLATKGGNNLGVWPLFKTNKKSYIKLSNGSREPGTGIGPRTAECAFWREYVPKLNAITAKYTACDLSSATTNRPIYWSTIGLASALLYQFYLRS